MLELLAEANWTQIGTGAIATLGILAAVFGALRAVISFRNGRAAVETACPPQPPSFPCPAHGVRLDHLEAETEHARDARERMFQSLDDHGQRLARIEGGIGEIKTLLKGNRS